MITWNKENRFALLVGGTSALVLLIDNKHGVKRDGFLEPAWTLLLYVAFPLLICAFYEAKKKAAAWSFAALGRAEGTGLHSSVLSHHCARWTIFLALFPA